jgi:hypothetical protein
MTTKKSTTKKSTTKKTTKSAAPADPMFEALVKGLVVATAASLPTAIADYTNLTVAQTAAAYADALSKLRDVPGTPAVESIRNAMLGELTAIAKRIERRRVAPPAAAPVPAPSEPAPS